MWRHCSGLGCMIVAKASEVNPLSHGSQSSALSPRLEGDSGRDSDGRTAYSSFRSHGREGRTSTIFNTSWSLSWLY